MLVQATSSRKFSSRACFEGEDYQSSATTMSRTIVKRMKIVSALSLPWAASQGSRAAGRSRWGGRCR